MSIGTANNRTVWASANPGSKGWSKIPTFYGGSQYIERSDLKTATYHIVDNNAAKSKGEDDGENVQNEQRSTSQFWCGEKE